MTALTRTELTAASMEHSRRDFLKHCAAGSTALLFVVSGCEKRMTPPEARAAGATYRVLSGSAVSTLEAIGEAMVPGSAAAGLAHFVDHQLAAAPADSMLMIRYLGLNAPFTDFYDSSLAAVEHAAQRQFSQPFSAVTAADKHALVSAMSRGQIAGWDGPPQPLVFFVLRNDAVDVTYGTVAGFESLQVPYMAHIPPPTRWGE